ncbi:hypothetical protein ACFOUP_10920 [Belliella kenyensis]|uniref:Secretion system C-terminal sorting domain-containing protein n=2 Tax=Belliella kenyensis TaxID=1472724 RepID=A0ABV8EKP5_9BACT|nr:hypothetical protein [Belliella kenyensis]MDN3602186.1 hypothetical protein [Belliella kenyensis]
MTIVLLMTLSLSSMDALGQIFKKRTKVESEISFPSALNREMVPFELKPEGIKKFTIVLEKRPLVVTKIKVFDTLGNLIHEDRILPEDGNKKTFDFSNVQSQLFVVEVGNAKYNITKSIYAIPPGKRSSNSIQEIN